MKRVAGLEPGHGRIPGRKLHSVGFVQRVEIHQFQRPDRAGLHTGRQQAGVNAFPAHAAFFGVLLLRIIAGCAVGAGTHTVGTAYAGFLMVNDNAVLALFIRAGRAGPQTGGVVARLQARE